MNGVASNQPLQAFPPHYVDLKKEITKGKEEAIVASWKALLEELEVRTKTIEEIGSNYIPQVDFASLSKLSQAEIDKIKSAGSVVIRNIVDDEEAVGYQEALKEYVKANPQVHGFPEVTLAAKFRGDKQFFEMYWSSSQLRARSHPNVLAAGVFLNNLYHAEENDIIDPNHNLIYADRFRIRHPSKGSWNNHPPHIDGASTERWEDPEMRKAFQDILNGNWKNHDPFGMAGRLNGISNMFGRPNQTSMFRSWQGWLAMSNTGPGEGTLRVFPSVQLSNAYIMLRPFFRPVDKSLKGDAYLDASNWVFDVSSPDIPGIQIMPSGHFTGVRPTDEEHPHLRLDSAIVSIPRVQPGDMVFWHVGRPQTPLIRESGQLMIRPDVLLDVVHSVEQYHHGPEDSSAMYIPAVPLTPKNVRYLARHRDQFLKRLPPPDFPQTELGESQFTNKGSETDITTFQGRMAMGLESFEVPVNATKGAQQAIKEANAILTGAV
ncbi:hypothetical protein FRB96_007603 [Tulasnella sp. 330]|nr:hypothetical protein FRB96_007603 [Tulasnella sp. 330]